MARSVQLIRGGRRRCSTASCGRSTRISISLAASERVHSTIQPGSFAKHQVDQLQRHRPIISGWLEQRSGSSTAVSTISGTHRRSGKSASRHRWIMPRQGGPRIARSAAMREMFGHPYGRDVVGVLGRPGCCTVGCGDREHARRGRMLTEISTPRDALGALTSSMSPVRSHGRHVECVCVGDLIPRCGLLLAEGARCRHWRIVHL